jgi:hypothetical protein
MKKTNYHPRLLRPAGAAGSLRSQSRREKGKGPSTTEEITVTGTIIKMTSEDGSAANYQPAKTLVVREDRFNTPGSYVLNGPGHVVNKKAKSSKPRSNPALMCVFITQTPAIHG